MIDKKTSVLLPWVLCALSSSALAKADSKKMMDSLTDISIADSRIRRTVRELIARGVKRSHIAWELTSRGMWLYRDKNLDEAAAAFELAYKVSASPRFATPIYNRARIAGLRNNAGAAAAWLAKLKTLGPNRADRWFVEALYDPAFDSVRDSPAVKAAAGREDVQVVKRGFNLRRLVQRRYGGSFNRPLLRYNNLGDEAAFKPGDKIRVPYPSLMLMTLAPAYRKELQTLQRAAFEHGRVRPEISSLCLLPAGKRPHYATVPDHHLKALRKIGGLLDEAIAGLMRPRQGFKVHRQAVGQIKMSRKHIERLLQRYQDRFDCSSAMDHKILYSIGARIRLAQRNLFVGVFSSPMWSGTRHRGKGRR